MSATVQVTIDAHDPRALSVFWKEVLGYVHPAPPGVELGPGEDPLRAWDDFLEANDVPLALRNSSSALEDPNGIGPRIFFQQVPEPKTAKNRMHLDVRTATELRGTERMAALEARCEELVALGGRRLARQEPEPPLSIGFVVMADPEGNEFCLD